MSQPSKPGLTPLLEGMGSRLAELEARVKRTLALTDKVRAALDGPEKDHVVAASYRDDTLTIATDSAAWCAQIRFAESDLREKLAAAGETRFTKLKVRVRAGS